jgi:hypothetical protein
MLRSLLISALVLSLYGCGSNPEVVHQDSGSITLEHGKKDFRDAMDQAAKLCAKNGKTVKHENTSCPVECISTFACR